MHEINCFVSQTCRNNNRITLSSPLAPNLSPLCDEAMDIENVRETNILNNVRIMKIYISFLIENISPPLGSGYLRYKTIFCHKVDLDVQLMKFFI